MQSSEYQFHQPVTRHWKSKLIDRVEPTIYNLLTDL